MGNREYKWCTKLVRQRFSGSQFSGSTTPVILGWSLINGSTDRNISIRWDRKRHRDWERWDLSWTGEAVSPSGMVLCCTSSSSVPWWIMRVPFVGPPLASIPRNCKCCSPSVFALLATNAPWYTGNRQTHDDLRVPYFSDHIRSLTDRFDSKLADVGSPLVEQLGRHLRWPSIDLRPLTRGKQDRQLPSLRLPWLRFSVNFLSCKANARV